MNVSVQTPEPRQMGEKLAEGKTKVIYADLRDPLSVIVYSKDDITAGDINRAAGLNYQCALVRSQHSRAGRSGDQSNSEGSGRADGGTGGGSVYTDVDHLEQFIRSGIDRTAVAFKGDELLAVQAAGSHHRDPRRVGSGRRTLNDQAAGGGYRPVVGNGGSKDLDLLR